MQIEQAIQIIRQYQDQWGIKGLLETLEEMNLCPEQHQKQLDTILEKECLFILTLFQHLQENTLCFVLDIYHKQFHNLFLLVYCLYHCC